MTKTKIIDIISWILIIITIGSAFYFYNVLPEQVITHWNFAGEADGYSNKSVSAIMIPLIMILMYFLFQWLPKIDPKRKNYKDFKSTYKIFQLVIIAFFAIIYFIINLINLGFDMSVTKLVTFLVGLMFVIFGLILKDVKQNWFIGIRTPWTLSSKTVWEKTHQFGAKVFMTAGLLFLISGFVTEGLAIAMFVVILALVLSIIFYSYLIYKKQPKS
jgi:uncharacterized membrane protein